MFHLSPKTTISFVDYKTTIPKLLTRVVSTGRWAKRISTRNVCFIALENRFVDEMFIIHTGDTQHQNVLCVEVVRFPFLVNKEGHCDLGVCLSRYCILSLKILYFVVFLMIKYPPLLWRTVNSSWSVSPLVIIYNKLFYYSMSWVTCCQCLFHQIFREKDQFQSWLEYPHRMPDNTWMVLYTWQSRMNHAMTCLTW